MADDETPQPQGIELYFPPEMRGGVWSNFAVVSHSPYEFTIDFARLEFDGDSASTGSVVQRVSVSPLFITQLIEALQTNWERYAEKAAPLPEHTPGGEDDTEAAGG